MPTLPIADIRAIWQHYLDRLLRPTTCRSCQANDRQQLIRKQAFGTSAAAVNSRSWFETSHSLLAKHTLQISRFLAAINDFEFELPALESHQHPAKIIPRDFPAVDHE